MVNAGLFSGGKDSLYAIYLIEKDGINVEHLIFLIPSFPFPSPHVENFDAVKILAESMGKTLTIVDLHKGIQRFVDALKKLKIDSLVAGDIFIEEHVSWLKDICSKANANLLEPLFRRNTLDLFYEIFNSGFKAVVIGVDTKYLNSELLGFTLNEKTAAEFLLKIGQVDPLGENGEYHTIVVESPLYPKTFKIKSAEKVTVENFSYLHVTLEQKDKVFR